MAVGTTPLVWRDVTGDGAIGSRPVNVVGEVARRGALRTPQGIPTGGSTSRRMRRGGGRAAGTGRVSEGDSAGVTPAYAGGGGSPKASGTAGSRARNISAVSVGRSRRRWRTVRTTVESTC